MLLLLVGLLASDGAPPDFQKDVRPLLVDRCFACHGPDAGSRQAGLRLDLREAALEHAIVPGSPGESALVQRILAEDPDERMPPPESKLELTEAEREVLVRWIEGGAAYDEHWSFGAPQRSDPPRVENDDWIRDPIDRWILGRMEALGASPEPEASRTVWLRRVHLHLTGLPPSVEDLVTFQEGDQSHEEVVDALLASWEHAEHLAAPWLDLARYADTYGYQSDVTRRVWPWRDWVLGVLHDNLPYDEFVVQQIAGDLLPDATRDTRLATAFSRLHRQTNEGGSVEEEYRVESVADRVNTVGTAFLGLTLECARCHDHKYDPVSQREYFELFAFFDDIDEAGLYSHFTRSVPTPALDLPTEEQEAELAELEEAVRVAEANLPEESGNTPDLTRGLQAVYGLDEDLTSLVEDAADLSLAGEANWVQGAEGSGLELTGDDALRMPGSGHFRRSDPFTLSLDVRLPHVYERAVILHRSRAWTDAASRGYELLIEEGRASAALIHYWPGDALRVRTRDVLPTGRFVHLAWTYDGSSRAAGVRLFVDGVEAPLEVVRDGLTRTITGGGEEHLTIGERFRDRGLTGGQVDRLVVHDRALDTEEVVLLAAGPDWSEVVGERSTGEVPAVLEHLRGVRLARDQARDKVTQIMTMRDLPEPRVAHLLVRGSYDAPGEVVTPGTPAALPPLGDGDDRLALARWLVRPDHPLTARVEVNRLWTLVFDEGLSTTPEDFGLQGDVPEHRELLDELALDLIDSGWDRRALLRRLVLSGTYRQGLRQDEGGPWLGRTSRTPMTAEAVRDSLLATSGLLVQRVGGPSVKPYQPDGLWREVSGQTYQADTGEGLWRRSLYTFWKRTAPPPTMLMFGAPSREVCVANRPRSRSPQQALALWNDPQSVEAARVLAQNLEGDDATRLRRAIQGVWTRDPQAEEEALLLELLADARLHYAGDVVSAAALMEVGQAPLPEEYDPVELAAWTAVVQVLLSHEEATTIP